MERLSLGWCLLIVCFVAGIAASCWAIGLGLYTIAQCILR